MRQSIIFLLIIAGFGFIAIDQPLPAGLCFIAAVLLLIVKTVKKTVQAAGATAGVMGYGVKEEVSKAKGNYPDPNVFKEGIENAIDLTAQQVHAPDTHKFKYKGVGAFGEGCNKLIDAFKRVFR